MRVELISCDLCKKPFDTPFGKKFSVNKKALRYYGLERSGGYATFKWIYMDVCYECLKKLFEAYRDEQENVKKSHLEP